ARAVGSFDLLKGLIKLEEESGLVYQQSKASVYGIFSLNAQSTENLDAHIVLEKANVIWAQPFLTGYVHQLSGNISGAISLKGNASAPRTDGSIQLDQVGFTPDITGAHYTIENAEIKVTDKSFDLGSITVTDDHGLTGILSGS